MNTSHKTLLGFLLVASMNEQLHAWYPGQYILAWMTQSHQTNPAKTPDSVDIPCDKHKEYRADCLACQNLTRTAAAQKESELRGQKNNTDIACNAHAKYNPTCDACNELTRKAAEQKESGLRADRKNTDIACNAHTKYNPTCDACNALTRKASDQQASSLRVDNKNSTIPCGKPHTIYRGGCRNCNEATRAYNKNQ